MPLSGSYYYPQVHVANSSYPSVDIRDLTGTLQSSPGLGRLYVSASDLYFVDPDGVINNLTDQILSASQTVQGDFTVQGTTTMTGTLNVSGTLMIHHSGSATVPAVAMGVVNGFYLDSNNSISVATNGSQRWTFSAGGSLTAATALIRAGNGFANAPTYAFNADTGKGMWSPGTDLLGFSVNDIEIIRMQGTGELVGMGGHLILSSSAGSIVAASGAMKMHYETQANLPAGSDTLSGSVVWVSDSKFLAVYGPEGWMRIVTGTL